MQLCVVVLSILVGLAQGSLGPPERSYNILMLLPVSSKSHRNVFMPLAEALLDRGHKVTMLSNHPLDNKRIEHYHHGLPHFDTESMDMFEANKDPSKMFEMFSKVFPLLAKQLYEVSVVQQLYERRQEFDLIIMNHMFNDAMFPFVHGQKFITIATSGLDPTYSAKIGNLLNPAYVSHVMDYYQHPYSFIDRLKNIFFSIMVARTWRKTITDTTQIEISKRFPHLPSLPEIEANQSLTLINSHFSFGKSVPLLPNQVEMGGMHCRPAKPLPQDLKTFLDGDTPVVYMSLGSVARSDTMPKEYQSVIKNVFSKLPYKVLWKYEDESVSGLPKNVMIKKWMPQQDVLAHPNVKVFITHCGGLGIQEAMYHSTPMVGLPIFGDQPKNGKSFQFAGLGKVVHWKDLTEASLTSAITEVVTNPDYAKRIGKISDAFRDQLESPTNRAVFWTEYVIRHNGAPHLRSPELDLTLVQLLHLDILVVFHVALYLVYSFIRRVKRLVWPTQRKKKGKSKRE